MEPRIARQLPFPVPHPEGYPMLEDEPVYDPAWHLAIELPDDIKSLADLGYAADDARDCPTQLAITAPFRILSDAGAAALLDVCRALSAFTRSNERISRMVRGGAYQSRFLRDLCLCPEVTAAVSKLCQAPMHPHTIPHQLGHLNYNPHEVGENVDKWHVDTLRVDFVLFVTDPKAVEGGEHGGSGGRGWRGRCGADARQVAVGGLRCDSWVAVAASWSGRREPVWILPPPATLLGCIHRI